MRYDRQELADKIDYEGGTFSMLFGYGLDEEDLDPNDSKLIEAARGVFALREEFRAAVDKLEALLPEPGDN
jgi:hypothetical protein